MEKFLWEQDGLQGMDDKDDNKYNAALKRQFSGRRANSPATFCKMTRRVKTNSAKKNMKGHRPSVKLDAPIAVVNDGLSEEKVELFKGSEEATGDHLRTRRSLSRPFKQDGSWWQQRSFVTENGIERKCVKIDSLTAKSWFIRCGTFRTETIIKADSQQTETNSVIVNNPKPTTTCHAVSDVEAEVDDSSTSGEDESTTTSSSSTLWSCTSSSSPRSSESNSPQVSPRGQGQSGESVEKRKRRSGYRHSPRRRRCSSSLCQQSASPLHQATHGSHIGSPENQCESFLESEIQIYMASTSQADSMPRRTKQSVGPDGFDIDSNKTSGKIGMANEFIGASESRATKSTGISNKLIVPGKMPSMLDQEQMAAKSKDTLHTFQPESLRMFSPDIRSHFVECSTSSAEIYKDKESPDSKSYRKESASNLDIDRYCPDAFVIFSSLDDSKESKIYLGNVEDASNVEVINANNSQLRHEEYNVKDTNSLEVLENSTKWTETEFPNTSRTSPQPFDSINQVNSPSPVNSSFSPAISLDSSLSHLSECSGWSPDYESGLSNTEDIEVVIVDTRELSGRFQTPKSTRSFTEKASEEKRRNQMARNTCVMDGDKVTPEVLELENCVTPTKSPRISETFQNFEYLGKNEVTIALQKSYSSKAAKTDQPSQLDSGPGQVLGVISSDGPGQKQLLEDKTLKHSSGTRHKRDTRHNYEQQRIPKELEDSQISLGPTISDKKHPKKQQLKRANLSSQPRKQQQRSKCLQMQARHQQQPRNQHPKQQQLQQGKDQPQQGHSKIKANLPNENHQDNKRIYDLSKDELMNQYCMTIELWKVKILMLKETNALVSNDAVLICALEDNIEKLSTYKKRVQRMYYDSATEPDENLTVRISKLKEAIAESVELRKGIQSSFPDKQCDATYPQHFSSHFSPFGDTTKGVRRRDNTKEKVEIKPAVRKIENNNNLKQSQRKNEERALANMQDMLEDVLLTFHTIKADDTKFQEKFMQYRDRDEQLAMDFQPMEETNKLRFAEENERGEKVGKDAQSVQGIAGKPDSDVKDDFEMDIDAADPFREKNLQEYMATIEEDFKILNQQDKNLKNLQNKLQKSLDKFSEDLLLVKEEFAKPHGPVSNFFQGKENEDNSNVSIARQTIKQEIRQLTNLIQDVKSEAKQISVSSRKHALAIFGHANDHDGNKLDRVISSYRGFDFIESIRPMLQDEAQRLKYEWIDRNLLSISEYNADVESLKSYVEELKHYEPKPFSTMQLSDELAEALNSLWLLESATNWHESGLKVPQIQQQAPVANILLGRTHELNMGRETPEKTTPSKESAARWVSENAECILHEQSLHNKRGSPSTSSSPELEESAYAPSRVDDSPLRSSLNESDCSPSDSCDCSWIFPDDAESSFNFPHSDRDSSKVNNDSDSTSSDTFDRTTKQTRRTRRLNSKRRDSLLSASSPLRVEQGSETPEKRQTTQEAPGLTKTSPSESEFYFTAPEYNEEDSNWEDFVSAIDEYFSSVKADGQKPNVRPTCQFASGHGNEPLLPTELNQQHGMTFLAEDFSQGSDTPTTDYIDNTGTNCYSEVNFFGTENCEPSRENLTRTFDGDFVLAMFTTPPSERLKSRETYTAHSYVKDLDKPRVRKIPVMKHSDVSTVTKLTYESNHTEKIKQFKKTKDNINTKKAFQMDNVKRSGRPNQNRYKTHDDCGTEIKNEKLSAPYGGTKIQGMKSGYVVSDNRKICDTNCVDNLNTTAARKLKNPGGNIAKEDKEGLVNSMFKALNRKAKKITPTEMVDHNHQPESWRPQLNTSQISPTSTQQTPNLQKPAPKEHKELFKQQRLLTHMSPGTQSLPRLSPKMQQWESQQPDTSISLPTPVTMGPQAAVQRQSTPNFQPLVTTTFQSALNVMKVPQPAPQAPSLIFKAPQLTHEIQAQAMETQQPTKTLYVTKTQQPTLEAITMTTKQVLKSQSPNTKAKTLFKTCPLEQTSQQVLTVQQQHPGNLRSWTASAIGDHASADGENPTDIFGASQNGYSTIQSKTSTVAFEELLARRRINDILSHKFNGCPLKRGPSIKFGEPVGGKHMEICSSSSNESNVNPTPIKFWNPVAPEEKEKLRLGHKTTSINQEYQASTRDHQHKNTSGCNTLNDLNFSKSVLSEMNHSSQPHVSSRKDEQLPKQSEEIDPPKLDRDNLGIFMVNGPHKLMHTKALSFLQFHTHYKTTHLFPWGNEWCFEVFDDKSHQWVRYLLVDIESVIETAPPPRLNSFSMGKIDMRTFHRIPQGQKMYPFEWNGTKYVRILDPRKRWILFHVTLGTEPMPAAQGFHVLDFLHRPCGLNAAYSFSDYRRPRWVGERYLAASSNNNNSNPEDPERATSDAPCHQTGEPAEALFSMEGSEDENGEKDLEMVVDLREPSFPQFYTSDGGMDCETENNEEESLAAEMSLRPNSSSSSASSSGQITPIVFDFADTPTDSDSSLEEKDKLKCKILKRRRVPKRKHEYMNKSDSLPREMSKRGKFQDYTNSNNNNGNKGDTKIQRKRGRSRGQKGKMSHIPKSSQPENLSDSEYASCDSDSDWVERMMSLRGSRFYVLLEQEDNDSDGDDVFITPRESISSDDLAQVATLSPVKSALSDPYLMFINMFLGRQVVHWFDVLELQPFIQYISLFSFLELSHLFPIRLLPPGGLSFLCVFSYMDPYLEFVLPMATVAKCTLSHVVDDEGFIMVTNKKRDRKLRKELKGTSSTQVKKELDKQRKRKYSRGKKEKRRKFHRERAQRSSGDSFDFGQTSKQRIGNQPLFKTVAKHWSTSAGDAVSSFRGKTKYVTSQSRENSTFTFDATVREKRKTELKKDLFSRGDIMPEFCNISTDTSSRLPPMSRTVHEVKVKCLETPDHVEDLHEQNGIYKNMSSPKNDDNWKSAEKLMRTSCRRKRRDIYEGQILDNGMWEPFLVSDCKKSSDSKPYVSFSPEEVGSSSLEDDSNVDDFSCTFTPSVHVLSIDSVAAECLPSRIKNPDIPQTFTDNAESSLWLFSEQLSHPREPDFDFSWLPC